MPTAALCTASRAGLVTSARQTQLSGFTLRDATPHDFEAVVRLNAEWEHVTSPLDRAAVARLHEQSAYHRVVASGSGVVAFLLGIGPGEAYDSPNYRWFDARFREFLYIDRIVVSSAVQRAGLGAVLYDDVRDFAAHRGMRRLVCEVDVEPMNEPSHAFHVRRGFTEVGTQWVADGKKRVSLRECFLG